VRIFAVRRRARILVWAAGLIAITSLARAADPAPTTRAEVEARLKKATRGLSAAEVAGMGAGAGAWLAQIADDRAAPPTTRARAMEALTYMRTPATRDFLENFLIRKRPSSDAIDHVLLRKAAMALGWQAGPRSVDAVAALLDHPDPEVRLDAVVALGLTRARSAEKPLRDRLAAEPDAAVRAQIESQLRVLAGPSEAGKGARTPP
jgi:HEAT repeat protein